MSRSFKHQPFAAITTVSSAKRDKTLAHQGERRAFSTALAKVVKGGDAEEFLAPHRLECAWNEVYSWGRDGSQMYIRPGYLSAEWYVQMMRK